MNSASRVWSSRSRDARTQQQLGICAGFLLVLVLAVLAGGCACVRAAVPDQDSTDAADVRAEIREMFAHAYGAYKDNAFPHDELRPLSCHGEDPFGGIASTVVDALDSLLVFGHTAEFWTQIRWLAARRSTLFDVDANVSLFETNIRMLGGLLSAHVLAAAPELWAGGDAELLAAAAAEQYDGALLELALDLGRRLLPAFDTPSGMPYGTVNLRHGVPPDEVAVTCLASIGTFSLEFGALARLTGQPVFEETAKRAVTAVWAQRSSELRLLGTHINVLNLTWTHADAGIGPGSDSFYEYLVKAALLFHDGEYWRMWSEIFPEIMTRLRHSGWFLDLNIFSGHVTWPCFSALHGFWPGIQAQVGDVSRASETLMQFFSLWHRYGAAPEGYNLIHHELQTDQHGYALRPELAESLFFLYQTTGDPVYRRLGRDMVRSLNTLTRVPCGFASVRSLPRLELADQMDSFFLSETLKYLYLLFADDSHWLGGRHHASAWTFNTQAHPLPLWPEWRHWALALPDAYAAHELSAAASACAAPTLADRLSLDEFRLRA